MNLRSLALLPLLLLAAGTFAGTPLERIWQPAPVHPQTLPSSPMAAVPRPMAGVASWNVSFTNRAGDLWLGGGNCLAREHRGKWKVFASTNQFGPEQPVAFAETADGRVWCATPERVWQFDGRDWLATRAPCPIVRMVVARFALPYPAVEADYCRQLVQQPSLIW